MAYEVQVKAQGNYRIIVATNDYKMAKNTFEFYAINKGLMNLEEVLFMNYIEEHLMEA